MSWHYGLVTFMNNKDVELAQYSLPGTNFGSPKLTERTNCYHHGRLKMNLASRVNVNAFSGEIFKMCIG